VPLLLLLLLLCGCFGHASRKRCACMCDARRLCLTQSALRPASQCSMLACAT
jgi:hypothetical protein